VKPPWLPPWLRRVPRVRPIGPVVRPAPRPTAEPTAEPTADPTAPGYAPRTDGRPDPGEVVWAWVPYEDDPARGKDRPVLVLTLEAGVVLALPLTSKDHDRDEEQEARAGRLWMDIGSGAWDPRGRPSEVRINRAVRLPVEAVRREGAALDPALFRAVVAAATPYL
jgi:hypothetical protein